MVAETSPIKTSITIRVERLAHGLRVGSIFLEFVAVLSIVGGVILGVVVLFQRSTSLVDGTTTHPYVGAGVSIIVGAVVVGFFYWCVARALRLFAEHVAISHDVDLDSGMSILVEEDDDD